MLCQEWSYASLVLPISILSISDPEQEEDLRASYSNTLAKSDA